MKKLVLIVIVCFILFSSEAVFVRTFPSGQFEQFDKIELKYPVVLVHGIASTDRSRNFQPWGRISEVLQHHGIEVYYGNTDAWGDILTNAEILRNTVDSILENTDHEKVNIIAHSKGGIDARYFIWKFGYGDRVASLTTMATPHGGAEIADYFFNSRIIHTRTVRRGFQTVGRMFGDVNPDMYSVNQNLTTENMREFNANIPKDPNVFYQSIYSVLHDPSDDAVYTLSHAHIKNISGDNDGLVSEVSASWGYNPIRLPLSLSHRQIVDQSIRKYPGMEIPNIYLQIVYELGKRGF